MKAPMKSLKYLALLGVLVTSYVSFVSPAMAAGAGVKLDTPRMDLGNERMLQRGARLFVNYCQGCHSADYHRYSRLARDLGLTEEEVSQNLVFTTDETGAPTKIGSLMFNNMSQEYGKQAFGAAPPNLGLIARSRGADWVYTYLRSFYLDESRPLGVNNMVFPGASMPHVFWELQGWQKPVYEEHDGHQVFTGEFELVSPGSRTPEEFDGDMADLTAFLSYLADPIKQTRHKAGFFVLLFLFVLLAVSYLLKKEYWKDIK